MKQLFIIPVLYFMLIVAVYIADAISYDTVAICLGIFLVMTRMKESEL